MNRMPQNPDGIDQVLSDFFKSQMPHPWPAAPISAAALAEPSSLSVGHAPARRSTDTVRRARLTLAVSVAFLLGALWFLSPGGTGNHPVTKSNPRGPDVLGPGTATMPEPIDKHHKEKEKKAAIGIEGPIPLP